MKGLEVVGRKREELWVHDPEKSDCGRFGRAVEMTLLWRALLG